MEKHDLIDKQLRAFPVLDMVSRMFEDYIVPDLGGALHPAVYTEALATMLRVYRMDNPNEPVLYGNDTIKLMFHGAELGMIRLPITFLEVAVLVTSNSFILEKDIQEAKRVIRFGNNKYKMVMIVNVDWYAKVTFKFIEDGASV